METRAGRLSPPDWLLKGLLPQSAPIPWAAVARASVALAAPLAVGLAIGQPQYGALVSMGALSGVISDLNAALRCACASSSRPCTPPSPTSVL